MQLIIAEKPSVAREMAALLGVTEKKDGYLAGAGYLITWALGHLVTLAMPEDYGIKGFSKEALPILPHPFLLMVRTVKKDNAYVPDVRSANQLTVIRELFARADSIIVATDAGREGELIFRYIYKYLDCRLPFRRLWISSLTEKAIRQGFENLKPGSDFDGLYQAARSRSRADWLVGINATQALSIAAGDGIYSLGRVQTPTLALICKRYLENQNFVSKKYYQLQLTHRKSFVDFKSISLDKWEDKKLADSILKTILEHAVITVDTVEQKTVTEQPPLLFDLTGLQKEANKKLGLSAEETLSIAQSLYEKKCISYPRTGSRYIPEDMWEEIEGLVRALDDIPVFKPAVSKMKWGKFNKRIVNDLRVTDHHGLLITEKVPSALPPRENAVYEMIAYRLLEALSEACLKKATDVSLKALHYSFTAKGSKLIEAGWRAIKGSFLDDDQEPVQELPDLTERESFQIKGSETLEKQTRPPALYTEATLLATMETAGKQMAEEQQRKVLQGIGIGTPATRAAIIETLFTRDYIRREKKSLIPSSKGLEVYELVKDKKIADVAMTAEWELNLQKIEIGQLEATAFQKDMEAYAASITNELLQASIAKEILPRLTCPKCKAQPLIIREKIAKCPDEVACGWKQFRLVCGAKLTASDIKDLVETGKTRVFKGMKSKSGKHSFNARIILKENAESSFEFDNTEPPAKKR